MLDVLVLEVPDALRQPGGRPVPVRVPPHIPRVAVVAGLEGPAGLPAVRSHNCDRLLLLPLLLRRPLLTAGVWVGNGRTEDSGGCVARLAVRLQGTPGCALAARSGNYRGWRWGGGGGKRH